MKRLIALVVVAMFAHSSTALAGETLVESARRATQAFVDTQKAAPPAKGATAARVAGAALMQRPTAVGIENSGLRRRTKLMIAAAAIVAFAGIAWQIDHSVEDTTPSSLGTRQD